MSNEQRNTDSPRVIALPPLIFTAGFAAGLILEWIMPVHLFSAPMCKITGGSVAAAAGLLTLWGSFTMRSAGTNINPHRPTTVIVRNGPFRFSRNPLYISLIVLTLGGAIFYDVAWALVTLIPVFLIVRNYVVRREESYLEAKFGAPYLEYKAKVRRWI